MCFVHKCILIQIIVGFVNTKGSATKNLHLLQYQHPEIKSHLHEGDIQLDEGNDSRRRPGVGVQQMLWTNGIVPYLISPNYGEYEIKHIHNAIRTINYMTCIRIIPRKNDEVDYIYFTHSKKRSGCSSYIGRKSGKQLIILQKPDSRSDNCFKGTGIVLHELMHSLGVLHEQSRWDRDDYITVHFENIAPGAEKNFNKMPQTFASSTFEYDPTSIMHYGETYFSVDKQKPTITPKELGNVQLGQRIGMSVLDCLKLNEMYGCLDDPEGKERYFNICNSYGIKYTNLD